jgi:flagellar hook-associated protein 1
MDLGASLSIANSGIASINAQLAVVSHNVANAGTPGYIEETVPLTALDAGGIGMGVAAGPTALSVSDSSLQSAVLSQNATVGQFQTTANALSSLESIDGTPGQGNDLASLVGNLQDAFSTLLNDPSNQTQQSAVVSAAQTLAQGINTRSQAITTQSQAAQDDIVNCVNTINTTLSTIGSLSNQIIQAQATGSSTADLENQRQSEIDTLSQYLSINVLPQTNGDVLITTSSGQELPTRSTSGPLSTSGATVGPTSYYPGGGLPAVTLNGRDVTAALTGGQLGADLSLRDNVLPTQQAALDEFSANLASRFGDQGLALFTDGTGKIPSLTGPYRQSGYLGFAATIQVNPLVQNTPSLVRDGTPSSNTTGAAGYNTVITNVLNGTFGTAGPTPSTTGLGPAGNLNLGYNPPAMLQQFASDISSSLATASNNATNQVQTEQGVQTTLQSQLSSETGVSLDAEMSQMIALQNAYDANAHVLTTIQSMYAQLFQIPTTS